MKKALFILLLITTCSVAQTENYQKGLLDSVECLTALFYIPTLDYSIDLIKEGSTSADENLNHIYINTNIEKMGRVIKSMERYRVLNEMFVRNITDEEEYEGFIEVNSERITDGSNSKLIICLSFDGPCHFDEVFFLISNSKNAKLLLSDLGNIYSDQKIFDKLSDLIKT